MSGVGQWRRRGVAVITLLLAGLPMAGCETFHGQPSRLYSIAEEVNQARVDVLPGLLDSYRTATTDTERMYYRNEYISRRMYVIDAEFTEFETALNRERQEFGFSTALLTQGLTTAGAVFTPVNTVRTLSALAGGANATRGLYDSELLVNKTIQIVESQMEAKRDIIIANIMGKMGLPSVAYPLSAALIDLEDLYRAGTVSAGLIRATADAGEAAKAASLVRAAAMQGGVFQPNEETNRLLLNYFKGPKLDDRLEKMRTCLFRAGFRSGSGGPPDPFLFQGSANILPRLMMMNCARVNGDPM